MMNFHGSKSRDCPLWVESGHLVVSLLLVGRFDGDALQPRRVSWFAHPKSPLGVDKKMAAKARSSEAKAAICRVPSEHLARRREAQDHQPHPEDWKCGPSPA